MVIPSSGDPLTPAGKDDRYRPPSQRGQRGQSAQVAVVVGVILVAVAVLVVGVVLGLRSFGGDDDGGTGDIVTPAPESAPQPEPGISSPPPEVTVPSTDAPSGDGGTGTSTTPSVPTSTAAPTTSAPPAPLDLFAADQLAPVLNEVAAAVGGDPVRLLRVVVYPEYALFQFQAPDAPADVDEYLWRRGALGDRAPVQPSLTGGSLEDHLWSMPEVDWSVIEALVDATPDATGVADGEVSHVIVQRPLPFSNEVRIRVFVRSDRASGALDADAAGAVIGVTSS